MTPKKINSCNLQPSPMKRKEKWSETNLHEDMFHVYWGLYCTQPCFSCPFSDQKHGFLRFFCVGCLGQRSGWPKLPQWYIQILILYYCWWKKSPTTTWGVAKTPKNNGMNLSTGAGFQPSTVSRPATTEKEKDKTDNALFFPGRTNQLRSLYLTSSMPNSYPQITEGQHFELTKSSFPAPKKFQTNKQKPSGVPHFPEIGGKISTPRPNQTIHQTKPRKSTTGLVVSTHLKNISQIGNRSQIGVKIKKIFETTT